MRVLYLTYDGLTDPIGQAQVLPYLAGSAKAGHVVSVVSFEKADRRAKLGAPVAAQVRAAGMTWHPLPFRSSPPYVAKWLDQRAMAKQAAAAARQDRPEMIHCRSYVAGLAGLRLKQRTGVPMIFDMRGFWPDQRREGGRWTDESPLGSFLYRRWKRHEADLIAGSDHIVVLTEAARHEVETWPSYCGVPVSVIPCCVDFDHFQPASASQRAQARAELGLAEGAPTLVYLGSLGTVYLLDQQIRLFDRIRARDPRSKLLLIGRNSSDMILGEAKRINVALAQDDLRIVEAERAQVPHWLSAGDVACCFITSTYSSLGVSPTKLGEYLACGLPIYGNRGVGDVEAIVAATGSGHVLTDFSEASLETAAAQFDRLAKRDAHSIRDRARDLLDLPLAEAAYAGIYAAPDRPVTVGIRQ